MSKTPWTEGPYLISGHVVYALEDFHDRRGRYEQRNRITIQVDGGPDTPKEEVEAVKTLLAASPEMAEALEGITTWMSALLVLIEETSCDPDDEDRFDDTIIAATLALGRAQHSLAKARGDQ